MGAAHWAQCAAHQSSLLQIIPNRAKLLNKPQICYISPLQVITHPPKVEIEVTLVFFIDIACEEWNPNFSSFFAIQLCNFHPTFTKNSSKLFSLFIYPNTLHSSHFPI